MSNTPIVRVVDCHVARYEGSEPRFLVLRRAPGQIYAGDCRMVGGKIRRGEAAWEAALRELKEETGLEPARFFALPFISRFYEPEHDRLNDIPVFLALMNGPEDFATADVRLDAEHDHYQWLSVQQAKHSLAWPGQKAGIDAAVELIGNERLHRYLEISLAQRNAPRDGVPPMSEGKLECHGPVVNADSASKPVVVDTQASSDPRGVCLDEVGVCDVLHPFTIGDGEGVTQGTVAKCSLAVTLEASHRGTHMSRFLQILNEWAEPLSLSSAPKLARQVRVRLEAEEARVEFSFPWFAAKRAPSSGVVSLMDYAVTLRSRSGATELTELSVRVPVKSLCPCSKAISEYGAHNQRSHISVTVVPHPSTLQSFTVGGLIVLLESQGSAQVYGVLKRADERWITEAAYDNPKFVEDITRDIVLALRADPRLERFSVRVENFESIHNHTAFARYDG